MTIPVRSCQLLLASVAGWRSPELFRWRPACVGADVANPRTRPADGLILTRAYSWRAVRSGSILRPLPAHLAVCLYRLVAVRIGSSVWRFSPGLGTGDIGANRRGVVLGSVRNLAVCKRLN